MTICDLIKGKNPELALPLRHGEQRNPACWAAPLGIECAAVSPYGGVAVSGGHVLYAAHYMPAVGAPVWFSLKDGTLIERTVIATAVHPDRGKYGYWWWCDLGIALLSEMLPAGIRYPILQPANWYQKLCYQQPPALVVENGHGMATVANVGQYFPPPAAWVRLAEPTIPILRPFYRYPMAGDSSGPVFLVDNAGALRLCCLLSSSISGWPIDVDEAVMLMKLVAP